MICSMCGLVVGDAGSEWRTLEPVENLDLDSDSNDEDHWKNDYPDDLVVKGDIMEESDDSKDDTIDNTEVTSSPEESADEDDDYYDIEINEVDLFPDFQPNDS